VRELLFRLLRRPTGLATLLVASLAIHTLALASSLYAIQILNRYVSHGVEGTLVTLTVGVLIAIVCEYAFRRLRLRIADGVLAGQLGLKSLGAYALLLSSRLRELELLPAGRRGELVGGVHRAEQVLGATAATTILDLPFSLLFLFVISLLSWPLAMVAALLILLAVINGWLSQRQQLARMAPLHRAETRLSELLVDSAVAAETIRLFPVRGRLLDEWREGLTELFTERAAIQTLQGGGQARAAAMQGLLSVSMFGIGSVLVVRGELDVGALIGVNILAARALSPALALSQQVEALGQAQQRLREGEQLGKLAGEGEGGVKPLACRGDLVIDRLSLRFAGAAHELFSQMTFAVRPGSTLVISGSNGSGKSTMARLLAGLYQPDSGRILVDGVELRQLDQRWWRNQLIYLPQEPSFITATLRDNLLLGRDGLDDHQLRAALDQAGVGRWVDGSGNGLDQMVHRNGADLPLGIRRRLALARGLLSGGQVVILDDPLEGLDRQGVDAIYRLMVELVRSGKTLIVCTQDQNLIRGAQQVIDLDGLS
jgi:ATP-binding cassette subfamily C protein LapB